MSSYLVERITASPDIEVRLRSEVAACAGDGHLETLTLVDRDTGEREEVSSSWLFVFIGASPRTSWLGDAVVPEVVEVEREPALGVGPDERAHLAGEAVHAVGREAHDLVLLAEPGKADVLADGGVEHADRVRPEHTPADVEARVLWRYRKGPR